MHRISKLIAVVMMAIAISACKGGVSDGAEHGVADTLKYAEILQISHCDGYVAVSVADPWHTGSVLHRYALVPRDVEVPAGVPADATVVRVPLENAVVYASVHVQALDDISAFSAVKGVCDAEYFKLPKVTALLRTGEMQDLGSSMSPNIEKILAMKPDAVILSPFENAGYGQLATLGVPIIECADYMEQTPLGRAEWIKFLGELTCRRAEADSVFASVEKAYLDTKRKVSANAHHPTVLTECLTGGVWYVPGGKSYMAQIIADAGGDYLWSGDTSAGSLALSFEQVLSKAQHADVWLIKTSTIKDYATLKAESDKYAHFDAVKNRNVWVCDTQEKSLFEEFPFHPERLLAEMAQIFTEATSATPDSTATPLRYYSRLK